MLSSSLSIRARAPRSGAHRNVTSRAFVNGDDALPLNKEALAEQIPSLTSSAVDTTQRFTDQVSKTVVYQLSDAVQQVKEVSEDMYSEVMGSEGVSGISVSDMSNQLTNFTDDAAKFSSEVLTKSAEVSAQLSSAVSGQMASLPEVQAQLLGQGNVLLGKANDAFAIATETSTNLSSQFAAEFLPRVSAEVETLTQLAAAGQYAEAASSPAGIAAAGASLLLFGGLATSAFSTPSTTSAPSASDNRASAQAWIATWRATDAPDQLPPSRTPSPPTSPATSDSSSSASSRSCDDMAPAAGSNGTAATNGATPDIATPEIAFAEYISGDATPDQSSTGGWYVSSSDVSDSEGDPYSELYAPGGNGGNGSGADAAPAATDVVTAEDVAPAPVAMRAGSRAESGTDLELEAAGASTATLEALEGVVEIQYHTGWQTPTIHACVAGGEWSEALMHRDEATGVLVWRRDLISDAAPFESGAICEFVVTDGAGDWDKSPAGENYRVYRPGIYDLREGQLRQLV